MKRIAPYLLLLPVLLLLGFAFIWPELSLLVQTIYVQDALGEPLRGPTLDNFSRILSDPFYLAIVGRTLRISLWVTVACLILGYPVALDLSRRERKAALLVLLLVLPLTVSIVVRGVGWVILTTPNGAIPNAARFFGLPGEPFGILYTELAVVIGLTNALLPFMVLSLQSTLENIDPSLARAASDLGARPLETLARVTLPLSLPGAGAGAVIVFTLAASFFAIPAMLGGERVRVLSGVVYDQAVILLNPSFAAAVAVVLLAVVVVVLWIYHQIIESGRWQVIFERER